ncbi:MAG: hypothetical protein HY660_18120 [Armatimonadetes bacterium]|nr:hypothetical protein [Armatimonadota bacterium]
MRLAVLQRAQALGISRTPFHRWRARFRRYGVDGDEVLGARICLPF